ncbi:Protein of unknown function [Modicisalibacter muralis]|uniref:DUF2501 domain-containing protein n=1 Tax=Modicisalibacter muralis TaxID=119000 RepID=A0A1G9RZJ3_9GAMM|nr:DUF2501 domain-containing protein [Halomonas muralis]SDM27905.1 Protein of unknown function [Halomonas muralis]
MNIRHSAMLAMLFAMTTTASAQSLDSLKESAGDLFSGGSESASGASFLGSLGSGSFSLGSMENVAGVLGYCQEQGYTSSATEMAKDRLMEQIGGQQEASQDSAYQQGLSGILQGEGDKSFSLGGVKDQVGEKVCNTVADQAISSFLGG